MYQDGFHGPMNLGNPNEFTVKELAEMVVYVLHIGSLLSLLRLASVAKYRWTGPSRTLRALRLHLDVLIRLVGSL